MEPEAEILSAARRRVRRTVCLAALLVLSVTGGALHGHVVATWLEGSTDLLGRPVYEPPYGLRSDALESIDLARVHGALLPSYMIAASRIGRDTGALDRADDALAALRAEAGQDPNLDALLGELGSLLRDDALQTRPRRILYLVWAWSSYLDRAGLPWWVEASVLFRDWGGFLCTKSYHVHRDLRVAVGPDRYRVRLIGRVDRTNVRERHLGHAGRDSDGALVVVDRVEEFALERLMPVLGPGGGGACNRGRSSLAAHVRDEIIRGLGGTTSQVLAAYATARCAEPAGGAEDALPESMARTARCGLVAWAHRVPVIHETRHVADDERASARDRPLACAGCPDSFGIPTRLELSAYLASFAAEGTGYAALLQACAVESDDETPHARALRFLTPRLLPHGCDGEVPDDLYARAQELEQELFGRSDEIALPDDFPRCVVGWRYSEPDPVL